MRHSTRMSKKFCGRDHDQERRHSTSPVTSMWSWGDHVQVNEWQESEIARNRVPGREQFHTQGLRIEKQSLSNRFLRSLLH